MITEQRKPGAISWDLDDTLFQREGITRVGGALTGRVKTPRPLPLSLDEVPIFDRTVVDTPFRSIGEKIAFRYHSEREMFPGVPALLGEAIENGIDNFANTGRENKRVWVDMTGDQLAKNGIAAMFEGLYFTPEGERRNLSKADAIRGLKTRYESVVHVDDDPRTVLYLAHLFPDTPFYLIHYPSTGRMINKRVPTPPNVLKVNSFKAVPISL